MKEVGWIFTAVALTASGVTAEHWWQFGGPGGNGHTTSVDLPIKWDEKNVVWKTEIHDRGWSSPVIWGEQIWVTTATEKGNRLFAVCVHKDTGKILHDIHVFDVDSAMAITSANTYATPTPTIEEGRVYVHYGTYGTACINTANGAILWSRRDLKCDHEKGAGPASSPFLLGDHVIFHVDGRDVQYVIALKKSTGETVWKAERSLDYADIPVHHRKAYGMPTLIPRGNGTQLVGVGGRGVFSYDPRTGKELWKARHRGWSIAPRPVFGNGLLFAIIDRDNPELWAIRPDGNGDVTDTHVAWRETKRMPARASPLLVGDLLFLVNRNGIASCLEARTGKIFWQERIKGAYSASPIYSKGRIYLFNEDSVCTVIKPARKLEVLSVNPLSGEQLMATPAVDGDSFLLRTDKHLYRVTNPAPE
ncbi:MAG: PQQ-like beta-propeller repeat protein [Roseibacillus sp.]|nr:PQQ-like beta-propeller repeat protein [Roseibacillus sp.]